MSSADHLYCFFYSSRISPSTSTNCIVDILKTARSFNKQAEITGILVFNGIQFHQYIEGPKAALQELIERISKDQRHTDFTPRYSEPLGKNRLFSNWSMAYILLDDSESDSEEINTLNSLPAIDKLKEMISQLEKI